MRLKKKVAIVTGSASGIGEATALLFAQEGARLVVADINTAKGESVVDRIKREGGEGIFVETDVSSEAQVMRMVATVVQAYGTVDVLFNNAGFVLPKEIHETTEDEWNSIIGVHLKGVFLCCKHVVPVMIEHGGGSILSNSSAVAIAAEPACAAYCAAKGGINALTRAMALDYGHHGIRVNALCPGYVDTPLGDDYFNGLPDPELARRKAGALHALGRTARPMEIAYAALFLASDESSFVTGECLVVDAGLSVIVNPAPGFGV
jgi:meso-butanediol dehydrogenase/(S,S)-butanediol dehydrogenase/diacetyl reductase